jgi:uncharacterized protein (DUF427 family)
MPKAIWNGATLAESNETQQVEGNHYFPPDSLDDQYFRPSDHTTVCGWKGTAGYYDVVVDGEVNQQAAWHYAEPKPEAENIRGYVAFWKGVSVEP